MLIAPRWVSHLLIIARCTRVLLTSPAAGVLASQASAWDQSWTSASNIDQIISSRYSTWDQWESQQRSWNRTQRKDQNEMQSLESKITRRRQHHQRKSHISCTYGHNIVHIHRHVITHRYNNHNNVYINITCVALCQSCYMHMVDQVLSHKMFMKYINVCDVCSARRLDVWWGNPGQLPAWRSSICGQNHSHTLCMCTTSEGSMNLNWSPLK